MWMFGLKKRNSMKRTIFISIFFAAFVLPFSVACGGDETVPQQQEHPDTPESPDEPDTPSSANGKVLVAYFSRANHVPDGTDAVSGATNKTRNTQTVAMELSRLTGGDLFEIIPARDYPVSHTECSEIALQEYEADARPALTTHVDNMEDYDIIYIGFPIWRYCEPMAIRTFLEEYDFTGKTIRPFCTSMAVGIEDAQANIARLCPESSVADGLRISYNIPNNLVELLSEWIGIK